MRRLLATLPALATLIVMLALTGAVFLLTSSTQDPKPTATSLPTDPLKITDTPIASPAVSGTPDPLKPTLTSAPTDLLKLTETPVPNPLQLTLTSRATDPLKATDTPTPDPLKPTLTSAPTDPLKLTETPAPNPLQLTLTSMATNPFKPTDMASPSVSETPPYTDTPAPAPTLSWPAMTASAIAYMTSIAPGSTANAPSAIIPAPHPAELPFAWPSIALAPDTAADLTRLASHGHGLITALAWSHDATRVTAGTARGVRIYDATTRTLLRAFDTAAPVEAVALDATGARLAVALKDHSLLVYVLATGEVLAARTDLHGQVYWLTFSPDTHTLGAATYNNDLLVWDFVAHSARLIPIASSSGAAFSPDGQFIFAAQPGRQFTFWNVQTGAVTTTIPSTYAPRSVAFSPDNTLLALGFDNGTVHVYAAPDWHELWTNSDNDPRAIEGLAFSSDSTTLTALTRINASTWDRAGAPLQNLSGFRSYYGIALAPGGQTLAVHDLRESLDLWDIPRGTLIPLDSGFANPLSDLAFDTRARPLITGARNGIVRLWDPTANYETRAFNGLQDFRESFVALSPDGTRLATGSEDGVTVRDAATGAPFYTVALTHVTHLAFSPDGTLLAASALYGAKLIEVGTGRELIFFTADPCDGIAFSPDGATLALSTWEQGIGLWDVATLTLRTTLAQPYASVLAYAPDGTAIAVSEQADGPDWPVILWDPNTETRIRALTPGGYIDALAYSHDGRLLAVGTSTDVSDVHTLVLYDARTGRELVRRNATGLIRTLAFSADGALLASADEDGLVWFWGVAR